MNIESKAKFKVIKSKSSNNAIKKTTPKTGDKKSRSNAEFEPRTLKRRGLYVEKKRTKTRVSATPSMSRTPSPPKNRSIKRVDSKQFMYSALTILSKNSTGTQPTKDDGTKINNNQSVLPSTSKLPEIEEDKPKTKRKSFAKKESDTGTAICKEEATEKKPKKQFRSKVLRERNLLDQNMSMEPVLVLKSKNDMVRTPSLFSESGKISNVSSAQYILKKSIQSIMTRKNFNPEGIGKENISGTDLLIQDKKGQGIYKFFVDVIENSFNVYDAPIQDKEVISIHEPKAVNFEINESVAGKLNILEPKKEPIQMKDMSNRASQEFMIYNGNAFADEPFPRIKKTKRRKPKQPIESKSVPVPTKKPPTRNHKKHLLAVLKEKLSADVPPPQEPKNIYQALKLMAKHKRRTENTIQFQPTDKKDKCDCKLKRRQYLLNLKADRGGNEIPEVLQQEYIYPRRSEPIPYKESQHSLVVYGMDYEEPPERSPPIITDTSIYLPRHSSTDVSDFDFDPEDAILRYSTDSFETLTKYRHLELNSTK